MLYGSETFTIKAKNVRKIEAFEMWTIRRMLRISWKQKVTNAEVLHRAKVSRELLRTMKARKTRYFGHLIRQDGLQKRLLEGKVNGKRLRGRQRSSWMSNIKDWTRLKSYSKCVRAATDRMVWRRIVADVQKNEPT